MVVQEIPQDSIWLDPQTERLVRVNREPSHPGIALREFSELYCNLRSKYFVQGCWHYLLDVSLLYIHCRTCTLLQTPLLRRGERGLRDQSGLTAERCSGHYWEWVTMVVSARHFWEFMYFAVLLCSECTCFVNLFILIRQVAVVRTSASANLALLGESRKV